MLSELERHEVVRLITKELNRRDAETKKPLSEHQISWIIESQLNHYIAGTKLTNPRPQPMVDANTVVLITSLIALACTLAGFVAGKAL